MSSLDMLRTIKIRSVENAVYRPNYNRMRFMISPDNMSTDLSESYLAFKLYVVNGATKVAYTKEEIANLDTSSIMFSFGDSLGEVYSPSCLIKVARLYAQGNQSQILEEVQYSNVLTQTLHNFKNDFETIAAESLLTMGSTGMLLNGSLAASTSSYFGSPDYTNDSSVQVNIKLSDLFGYCRSNNAWLSITEGLMVELELEDVKPLITQSCVVDLSTPYPNTVIYSAGPPALTTVGYTDDPSTNHFSVRCSGQNLYSPSSNAMASLLTTTSNKISTPQCYRYDSSYISSFFPSLAVDTADLIPGSRYQITALGALTAAQWQTAGCLPKAPAVAVLPTLGSYFDCLAVTAAGGTCALVNAQNQPIGEPGSTASEIKINPSYPWTTGNMISLGIEAGVMLKLVFKITQTGHVPRYFEYIDKVYAIGAWQSALVPAIINLDNFYLYPEYIGTYLQGATVELDSFEVLPNSVQFTDLTSAQYQSLITSNKIEGLTTAQILNFQIDGLLSGGTPAQVTAGLISNLTGSNVFFNASASLNNEYGTANVNTVNIYPDEFESPDIPSLRRLYSNQTKKLPVQTGLLKCVKADLNGGNWDVTFSTAGLINNNSLQYSTMIAPGTFAAPTPGLGVKTTSTSWNLNITNAKRPISLDSGKMVVGEWYYIVDLGTGSDAQWIASGALGPSPAAGDSFQCVAPLSGVDGEVLWLQPNKSASTTLPKTYEITKAELVLVQREKDPSMPPTTIFSTYRCEAVTIENQLLTEYNRQFIITEPNCFNVLLCCPPYSGTSSPSNSESLISKARNINQYRWSVNNIDNTNRNIVVMNNTSSYPSTLHLDKLLDTFKNDTALCRALSGVNGVARSVEPPVVFPLKIYTASDAESHYLNPMSGYTIQFAAYSDNIHDMYITPGPVFLFKQCFKVLPPVPGM